MAIGSTLVLMFPFFGALLLLFFSFVLLLGLLIGFSPLFGYFEGNIRLRPLCHLLDGVDGYDAQTIIQGGACRP